MSEPREFRPDLEGLRAVAVVLVLLYHAEIPGFPGGYVGVDVFFVLSGFLITGLLIRELRDTGRISFPAFYARRARRLLPAAALTLVVTVVASAILLPPLRMPDVAGDTIAAGLYVSNMRFAFLATDYLGSQLPPSPILHFWSLGVEEQFYLFWPTILAVAAGAAYAAGDAVRGARRVGIALAVVFVASLAGAVWLTGVSQPWAFFSLPTRAWELALGGLLALPAAARRLPRSIGPALGWSGVVLVVLAGAWLNERTPFPGTAALLPTVGAAMVIAAGLPGHDGWAWPDLRRLEVLRRLPAPGPLLSLPPVRFLGRISYSLYLWHWPILVLPAAALDHRLPGLARVGLAGLAIVVAAASQRWVEDPIRRGRFVGTRPRRVLALAGAASLAVAISSMSLAAVSERRLGPTGPVIGGTIDEVILPTPAATGAGATSPGPTVPGTGTPGAGTPGTGTPGAGSPGPTPRATPTAPATLPPLASAPVPADLAPSLAAARDDLPVIYGDGCHLDAPSTQPPPCVFGDPSSSTTVVLFGDSHAAQWFPALERIARQQDWRLISMTKSACASVDIPVWSSTFNRRYTECDAWRANAEARIAQERPAMVVIANDRGYSLAIGGQPAPESAHEDLWSAALQQTIQRLGASAGRVVLIGDTVRMAMDPPVCLSDHTGDASACSTPWAKAVATRRLALDQAVAATSGATFVNPDGWMCVTDPCPSVIGRLLVYRDNHHMTATFSRALASRLLAALPAIAGS